MALALGLSLFPSVSVILSVEVFAGNTFDSNLMSVQSDCPHRERFGYGGDPLGCGEAGLSIYDWSTFCERETLLYCVYLLQLSMFHAKF